MGLRSHLAVIVTLSGLVVTVSLVFTLILHTRNYQQASAVSLHYQHGMLRLDVETSQKSLGENDLLFAFPLILSAN